MAPFRRDPFRDILFLQERMSRIFDEALMKYKGGQEGWFPPVDIYETGDSIVLKAELPGLDIKDISIEVKGNTLVIRGERRKGGLSEDNYYRMERFSGSFQRSFTVPFQLDEADVKARLNDGVLKITLPRKSESGQGIKIKVQ